MNKKFSLHTFFATCGFVGYIPFCPGTAGSLVAMLALYFLPSFSLIAHFLILNILFLVGTVLAEGEILSTQQKDPQHVVIDEWVGMWIALSLAPKSFWLYLLAFVIFRIFDIVKPRPISTIEQNTPGGLGVMLDDAVAGFFTFVFIQGICLFL